MSHIFFPHHRALLGAHIANVVVNWKEMKFNYLRAVLGVVAACHVGFNIYEQLNPDTNTEV